VADAELIITRALALGAAGADHLQAAEELVRTSAGRRELLERAHFVARLHSDVSDYEATKALTLVNAALSQLGWPTEAGG
jgi:hypothetical protein